MIRVLDKDPATTFVVIDEVETDNWGVAGETVFLRYEKDKAECIKCKITLLVKFRSN